MLNTLTLARAAALVAPARAPALLRSPRCTAPPCERRGVVRGAVPVPLDGKKMVIVAAGALVRPDGRLLVAQRRDPPALAGLWEFPGGKVDAGETLEGALARELEEELGVVIDDATAEPLSFSSRGLDDERELLMCLFVVRAWDGEPRGREGQDVAWVVLDDLDSPAYPMPPADLPFIPAVRRALGPAAASRRKERARWWHRWRRPGDAST